jgi:membrane protease YdiL (CAAX protease family)
VIGLATLTSRATAGPAYPPTPEDLRDVRVAGLDFPLRATVALFVATLLVLLDYTGVLQLQQPLNFLDREPDPNLLRALERAILFGLVPLAVVVLGFRDRPSRYGLKLGDWRWGLGLLLVGLAIMTPIILGLAQVPAFRDYYGAGSHPGLLSTALTNALELFPAEFLLRGFLLFALYRRIGPLALIVVQVPFIFAHIGKPELELYSTFIGGTIFAWLDWRTGSIVWSALGHLYVLTLMLVAVSAVR